MKTVILLLATTSLYVGYYLYNNYYRKDFEFSKGSLVISGDIEVKYKIKIADNFTKREKGLMFVEHMPEDEGMLFIYDDESLRYMWMKNTYISLDMLFVSSDMKIVHMKEGAVPFSEELIPSLVPIKYTIELNAGQIKNKNIKIGDRIEFKLDTVN
ncbi:MAG TPA: DUF192 domain-containing protein [Alphaproteobacteria bacterium]|nr:DUF192 domain-containing protein [Alphaproteobacteria bacterium]